MPNELNIKNGLRVSGSVFLPSLITASAPNLTNLLIQNSSGELFVSSSDWILKRVWAMYSGSVTASVNVDKTSIFLIKSGSRTVFNIDESGSVITSGSLTLETSGSYTNLLNVKNNGTESLKVNGEGVLVLRRFDTPPTAVSGGIYFDTSGSFFYGN
jgi:hypothetical protein